MLNPTNGDQSHVVVNYVEEYLDLVESLPFDLQRSVSLMKEIDAKYQGKNQMDTADIDVQDTNIYQIFTHESKTKCKGGLKKKKCNVTQMILNSSTFQIL